MALTKKDKEEIVDLIKSTVLEAVQGHGSFGNTQPKTNYDDSRWHRNGIHSNMLDAVVAPENLVVTLPDGTEKKYFTFDEAQEWAAKLPDGWRLPTRSEWAILAEEFGNNPETGKLDAELLMKNLNLSLDGWMDFDDNKVYYQAANGNLWSGTTNSASNGYYLNYNSGEVRPANYDNRIYGFPVRCIARES